MRAIILICERHSGGLSHFSFLPVLTGRCCRWWLANRSQAAPHFTACWWGQLAAAQLRARSQCRASQRSSAPIALSRSVNLGRRLHFCSLAQRGRRLLLWPEAPLLELAGSRSCPI